MHGTYYHIFSSSYKKFRNQLQSNLYSETVAISEDPEKDPTCLTSSPLTLISIISAIVPDIYVLTYACMQFKIAAGAQEYVTKIDGSIGPASDGDRGITSLSVTTSRGKTETYGDPKNGTAFTVPLENAGIFAFFASSDTYLNAVGFYVQPYP